MAKKLLHSNARVFHAHPWLSSGMILVDKMQRNNVCRYFYCNRMHNSADISLHNLVITRGQIFLCTILSYVWSLLLLKMIFFSSYSCVVSCTLSYLSSSPSSCTPLTLSWRCSHVHCSSCSYSWSPQSRPQWTSSHACLYPSSMIIHHAPHHACRCFHAHAHHAHHAHAHFHAHRNLGLSEGLLAALTWCWRGSPSQPRTNPTLFKS